MGTRNLTKVIDKTGKVVVAQYGQWDGYPAGQGVTSLYHAHNHALIESKLGNCHFLNEQEIDNINSILSASEKPISELYPTLSRDTCADIFGYVAYSTGQIPLVDESDFENDTGMCEAVYTLDFENRWFIAEWNYERFVWSFDKLPSKEDFLGVWKVR